MSGLNVAAVIHHPVTDSGLGGGRGKAISFKIRLQFLIKLSTLYKGI